jgi:hypothetical protein
MGSEHGGYREGAGRKHGSKNKMTIGREAVAEIIEAPDPKKLSAAIHQRGHAMLLELERIVLDPSQPIAARIMAARTALPFMLPKLNSTHDAIKDITPEEEPKLSNLELARRIAHILQIGEMELEAQSE